MSNKITEMTPFVFEDGNIYYFQILKREYSNEYHNIFVYEKKKVLKKKWFRKYYEEEFFQVGEPEMINIDFDVQVLKSRICKVIRSTKPKMVDGWDGFVGDVPDDLKKAFVRAAKIGNLFSE